MAVQAVVAAPGVTETGAIHYVDWGAILIGTVVAAAISLVLFTFGTAIGLSMVSPYEGEGVSATAYVIALALWTVWVICSSFMAGGYLSGRLRKRVGDATLHEVEVRDAAHGLAVWAVGIIIASLLLTLGVTGLVGSATRAAGSAATAAAASDANDVTAYTIDSLFRPENPATGAMQPPRATAPTGSQSMSAADLAPVPSASSETMGEPNAQPMTGQPAEAVNAQMSTSALPPDSSPRPTGIRAEDRAEVTRLLTLGMTRGELSDDNKTYVARLIAARTGMSETAAQARVNQVLTQAQAAADKARKFGIIAAFVAAAALALGAAAAAWGARLGGQHLDQATDLSVFWRWR
jgi:hypothetical protein